MSRHHFTTTRNGKRVDVQFGYDRPTSGFYLVVESEDADDDGYLYSNLADEELQYCLGHPTTIDHFLGVLDRLQITLPQQMIDAVRADGEIRAGNKVLIYDAQGNARTPGRRG